MLSGIRESAGRAAKSAMLSVFQKWILRYPLLATMAYARNRDFQLEAWGYFHALQRAREDSDSSRGWRYRLRTNIHILEKGISALNRREVFGSRIAGEVVADFRHLHEVRRNGPDASDEPLYAWSRDVLTTYFSVTGSDPKIDAARAIFQDLMCEPGHDGELLAPYSRSLSENRCGYDQLLALARQRRSVRSYLPDRVPRELIDRAMAVAALAPSSCNRQPFHYRICDDPDLIERLKDIPGGITTFNHLPVLIVITGDMRGCVESITNRHSIYVDACLSAMAFQFGLETVGLSSCCVHWSETRAKDNAVKSVLGLPPFERVVMFMVVGFPVPGGLVPRSHKKHIDELRSFNAIGPISG